VKIRLAFFSAILSMAMSLPLLAHHSFSAEYDETKPVNVTGVVKKVAKSPHLVLR
jgi:hypothetical protein